MIWFSLLARGDPRKPCTQAKVINYASVNILAEISGDSGKRKPSCSPKPFIREMKVSYVVRQDLTNFRNYSSLVHHFSALLFKHEELREGRLCRLKRV